MARLLGLKFHRHRASTTDEGVRWTRVSGPGLAGFPQLVWDDGHPWREANLWALELLDAGLDLKSVQANLAAVQAYATWLEQSGSHWAHFPARKADRCLIRYRGALVEARNLGRIAASTATQRMRVVVRFYRWLQMSGLLASNWPLWNERRIDIRLFDAQGFERTVSAQTTDLAIPNRTRPGDRLEGGLLPVSASDRDAILEFSRCHGTEELFLMLSLGFFTGMRLGTITDLKIETIDRAVPDPAAPGLWRLAVGPGADPPVATKQGVTGHIWITSEHLQILRGYARSVRRLLREAHATGLNRDLLFLTRYGNPYAQRGAERSPAINVELHALRHRARSHAVSALQHFRFHQTRCTFATELARILISSKNRINPIAIIQEALLHRNEATSLRYIRFVERSAVKEQVANAFTQAFLGLAKKERNSHA